MLFNSFSFLLLFLPAAVLVHAAALRFTGRRSAQLWLLLSSLAFYSFSRLAFLPLLAGSLLSNWLIGRLLEKKRGSGAGKALLVAGIAVNLIFLSCFKYVEFFAGVLNRIAGLHLSPPVWDFPLGVSFFTLAQIMFLVDTWQGLNPSYSLFDYASFVSFFPCISAGPITAARNLVPQFHEFRMKGTRAEAAARGLWIFAIGLLKKVALADCFSRVADIGFARVGVLSFPEAWLFSLSYTLQIYFDFSGYSDMAVGCAWMLGIDIVQNFDAPYRSASISEFWQRWHISLSRFITNYLYTPILRSLGKATLTTSAIATTAAMAIAGLWHGPASKYILFGILHGVALAANQVWKKKRRKMPNWLGRVLTFGFVNVCFVVFRSRDISSAITFLGRMTVPRTFELTILRSLAVDQRSLVTLVPEVIAGLTAVLFFRTSAELARDFRSTRLGAALAAALLLLGWCFVDTSRAKTFVYLGF